MTDSDARPEPIYVAEFEGEYVRTMVGSLPAISLPMEGGYPRNTHLRMNLGLRVRNVRYDELSKAEQKATGDIGGMKRVHIFSLEDAQVVEALTADQADEGAGGSAGGSQLRVEEHFDVESEPRECFYDSTQLAVVHRGGCEVCVGRLEPGVPSLAVASPAYADPGF